jgi:hypothetical protein
VAVKGPPSLFEISMAMGWLVRRMPVFPVPAVSFGETDGAARKTIVIGPQAVERLRRKRDHADLFQKRNGLIDPVILRLFRIDF